MASELPSVVLLLDQTDKSVLIPLKNTLINTLIILLIRIKILKAWATEKYGGLLIKR